MSETENLVNLLTEFKTPVTLNGEWLCDYTIPTQQIRKKLAVYLIANGVTINDVPVPVRCRDCKYYKPQNGSVRWNHKTPYCMRKTVMKVSPDDFCSFGEREVK